MTLPRRAAFEPGPVLAVVAAVVGIVLGQRAGPAPSLLMLGFGSVALVTSVAVSGRVRVVVAMLGIGALAFACTQRALNGEARSPLAALAGRAPIATVSGTLVSDPGGPAYLTTVPLRVNRISVDGVQTHVDGRLLVRATGTDAGEWRVLAEGDGVTAAGVLHPLEGRDLSQRWRHAVAVLANARLSSFASPRSPPFVVANVVRSVVLRGCAALDPVDRALLAGSCSAMCEVCRPRSATTSAGPASPTFSRSPERTSRSSWPSSARFFGAARCGAG
jgi:Domain of unknown function (DUF4131)